MTRCFALLLSCCTFGCLDVFKPVLPLNMCLFFHRTDVFPKTMSLTVKPTTVHTHADSFLLPDKIMTHLYRTDNRGSQVTLPHFYFNFIFLLSTFPEMEVLFLLYFLVPFLNNVLYGCILHVYWICHMRFGSCQSF